YDGFWFSNCIISEDLFYVQRGQTNLTGMLRGEIGRAEDPFLPSSGRKKLAEAGPPGKRPEEAKAGNCISMYK
ncbi:hypothetical protein C6Y45_15780, partial [Alkalicoccus saliphilus]